MLKVDPGRGSVGLFGDDVGSHCRRDGLKRGDARFSSCVASRDGKSLFLVTALSAHTLL